MALMMQARLMSTAPPSPQDVITTVVIDEMHNSSAHSDYVLALTLAVMQKTPDLRLVLMSATETKVSAGTNPPLSTTCDDGSYA